MKKLFLNFVFILVAWSASGQPLQPVSYEQLVHGFQNFKPVLFNLYREGHKEPELGLNCFKTKDKILNAIEALGMKQGRDYEIIDNLAQTGFVIILRNGAEPVIAWRFDMDALPLQEATGLTFKSVNEGIMHGCDHDIHFSTGVGILAQLHTNRQAWRGTAVIIAQPGEEGANGARIMVEEGIYRLLAEKNAFPDRGQKTGPRGYCLHIQCAWGFSKDHTGRVGGVRKKSFLSGGIRRKGGGSKAKEEACKSLRRKFEKLISGHTAGCPVKGIKWTYLTLGSA